MPKAIIRILPGFFTRRALVGVIQSRQQDHDARDHPPSARPHHRFPLTLTVGLMTIGVIAIVSAIQLLSSLIG